MTHDRSDSVADAKPMVALRYAPPLRRWHQVLANRLNARGHAVRFEAVAAASDDRRDVRLLLALERRLYQARSALYEPVPAPDSVPIPPGEGVGLTIRFAGDGPSIGRVVHPLFDGRPGERALFAALFAGRAPVISVCRDGSETVLAAGHPAIEDRHVLARSLDDVLPRLITLLVRAIDRSEGLGSCDQPVLDRPGQPRGSALNLLIRGLEERIRRRFGSARGRACRWRIAWRPAADTGVAAARAWPVGGYTAIAATDDRFQADPFPFEHEGRRHIFYEEYLYATGKGVIAHAELDASDTLTTPLVVLEQPGHLSYPLVLRHDGAIYMLPETSAARRLQLFRADPFPDRWVADRVLLDDTAVADATPIFHDGRWWLFATNTDDGGSSWDQLALYHAPDLFGPWTPHVGNPVLIDAGSARPAGCMWHEDGVLFRVAQDCRSGYGGGLAICRVDRLDVDGFAQTVVTRLGPPCASGAVGVHTLNRDGSLEVIDLDFV